MTDGIPPQLYGIWIPGRGWWKLPHPTKGEDAYVEIRLDVAAHYASKFVGHGCSVMPIDNSLIAGEKNLLALERERNDQGLRARLRRWWKGRDGRKQE